MRILLQSTAIEERSAMDLQHHVIVFPRWHRGDPDPRRLALVLVGFRWSGEAWRRSRLILSDETIDQMPERTWQQCLRRWTARRPQRRH
jgi:hypothetical protein